MAAASVLAPGLRLQAQEGGPRRYAAPAEFEPQAFIWLSWVEKGSLGGPPFSAVALQVMKLITPHVPVRLMYSRLTADDASFWGPYRLTQAEAEQRLRRRLQHEGIDLRRVELFYHPHPAGAIQDPGPCFLRAAEGGLAIADYAFDHPNPAMEAMDREIAQRLGLPTVPSLLVSEGGARQVNGRGTLLLVEAVELARNPGWTLDAIAREHLRVHGAEQVIWLKQGPADEAWGRLPDGRWGIGTGGHVDVFARFADARTVLLAQVSLAQRRSDPLLRETHARMEENFDILATARDVDGQRFRIVRVPVPDIQTARVRFDRLNAAEQSWFEGARPGETLEFCLPGGYLNFIIANGVVVTARLWRPGLPMSAQRIDAQAAAVLAGAFPGRAVRQLDVRPLLHDGGGLHCHSRHQPWAQAPR